MLTDLGQFFWHFDEPLLFLYKHRPPAETHRAAFLHSCQIYVKLCSNAAQWRREGFLQIPPTLEKTDAEAATNDKRFFVSAKTKSQLWGIHLLNFTDYGKGDNLWINFRHKNFSLNRGKNYHLNKATVSLIYWKICVWYSSHLIFSFVVKKGIRKVL